MTLLFRKALILSVVGASLVLGQPQRGGRPGSVGTPAVSFEVLPFYSSDSGSASVQVHYRIRNDFFVILRNTERQVNSPYIGKGELIVELKDDNNNSAAREFRSLIVRKASLNGENEHSPDIQGAFVLMAQPGIYHVWFNLDDSQSERSFASNERVVTIEKPNPLAMSIFGPVFVKPSPGIDKSEKYDVLNHGGDVFFGESGGALFNVRIPGKYPTVTYTLSNKREEKVLPQQEFESDTVVALNGVATLDPSAQDNTLSSTFPLRYSVAKAAPEWRTFYVPLFLETMYPGEATLSITFGSGDSSKHLERPFRILWPDKPRSLSNIEFAVEALKPIASEGELDSFNTLSARRFVERFFAYWRAKDRDTSTAYNELMAEYYRRVDIAIQRYSSSREVDGYKTDQGRIFILYGTPTNTQRLFSPAGPPREVWTYSQLKKRFVFEDQHRSGTYVLISVDTL